MSPRASYFPRLDYEFGIGDAANPLITLQHKNRHSKPPIRYRESEPLDEGHRFHLLQRHCAKRGRRHDFTIRTRDGMACLWCGLVSAEEP